jgi:hypothetical protein
MDTHDFINAELALIDSIPPTTTVEIWHGEAQRITLRLADRLQVDEADEDIEALIRLILAVAQVELRPIIQDASATVAAEKIIEQMQKAASGDKPDS